MTQGEDPSELQQKYRCRDCGHSFDVLGDRMDDNGDVVECCPHCDSDNIDVK